MKTSLHVQVSELVMGWGTPPGTTQLRPNGDYWWVTPGRKGICQGNPYCQLRRPSKHWNPTKDANHALEVVAAMHRKGYAFTAKTTHQGTWEATFTNALNEAVAAQYPSLAQAICIAARNAVHHP